METKNATVQETTEYIRRQLRDGYDAEYITCVMSNSWRRFVDGKFVEMIPADVRIDDVKIEVIHSTTGYARGSGSEPYRWVAGLTKQEREAVRAGHLVLVANTLTRSCDWYEVTYKSGKWGHRVPVRSDLLI